jgi:hypothetical protein
LRVRIDYTDARNGAFVDSDAASATLTVDASTHPPA